ncbi:MAG: carbohydrate binding family 9 domain-containing protein [Bacteroidetes bacterium]|nr:carbohydrate binding family 9 domain-containing protein [Bacteroidota bacterium]
MKFLLSFLSFLLFSTFLMGQPVKKIITAVPADESIRIDGILDEPVWSKAEKATGFTQVRPYNGRPARFDMGVMFLYDNTGLYVGAWMADPQPDSISVQLGLRDASWLNADDFSIQISPFNDGVNGFVFKVYSSDVQTDFKLFDQSGDSDSDYSWDAVWQSKVQVHDSGWNVEMKIPYSAIRFPVKDQQEWGVNCFRNIRRYRELDSWNPVDIKVQGLVNQGGILSGIRDIRPPLRLALYPYVSGYMEKSPEVDNWDFSYNYGADLKYGISQSFTLDMTLIPDFGQVPSDDRIYNFSPFEIQYDEKRQFFTEGTELFSKGDIFYSRRIGAQPKNYRSVYDSLKTGEEVKENPQQTKLINATKISGRTNHGLGIGFLNAMTSNTWAILQDSSGNTRKVLSQGFTNYNMIVLDQSLKNNSYVSFLNTNLYIPEEKYSANVTGTVFKVANKKYTYALTGEAILSQKYDNDLRPDLGYHTLLSFGKISGNLFFNYSSLIESEKYNPNDMGFNARNNKFDHSAYIGYNIYEPFGNFLSFHSMFYARYSGLYEGLKYSGLMCRLEFNATTRKQMTFGLNSEFAPIVARDYYEPRVKGRYYHDPAWGNMVFWFSSDYSRKLAMDGYFAGYYSDKYGSRGYAFSLGPRIQPDPRFTFTYSFEYESILDGRGYVSDTAGQGGGEVILFGNRDVLTITNVLSANYMFSSSMSLNARVRHYWITAVYDKFYDLQDDGWLKPSTYQRNHDINFNLFNIDLKYTWQFAPGSELSLVWKNGVMTFTDLIRRDFAVNLFETIDSPASNSLSVRLLYYLDSQYFKKKKKHPSQ